MKKKIYIKNLNIAIYATKNLMLMKKIKTTQKLEIMIITPGNLEVLLIVYVI